MGYSAELASLLVTILLVNQCLAFYVKPADEEADVTSLSDLLDPQNAYAVNEKRAAEPQDYFKAEKRYFCRKFFVYNPVRGRCQPTLLALRKGRSQYRY